MKRYIIISFLILSACGSNPPKAEAPVAEEHEMEQISATDEPTPPVKTVTPAENVNALTTAIRGGNDDTIYKAATQTLAQNPGDVTALNALGMRYYKKGQWLAAEYMFSRALKLNTNSSELYNNRGLVQLALKNQRDAIQNFRRALELDSDNAAAAANLGSIYVSERDFSKASVPLEMAMKKMSKDVRVLNNYALSLANTGKSDQAKGLYQDALKINANNKEVLFNYATLLIQDLNKPQEGLDILNKVKFLGPAQDMRNRMNALENKAKAGLK